MAGIAAAAVEPAVVAEVEPEPEAEEVVEAREMPNALARWVWLSGGLAQLRRSEARLGQLVLRMLREP